MGVLVDVVLGPSGGVLARADRDFGARFEAVALGADASYIYKEAEIRMVRWRGSVWNCERGDI